MTTYEYELGRRAGIMQAIAAVVTEGPGNEHAPEVKCDNCDTMISAGARRYSYSCSADCWADMHGFPEPEDTFEENDRGEVPD